MNNEELKNKCLALIWELFKECPYIKTDYDGLSYEMKAKVNEVPVGYLHTIGCGNWWIVLDKILPAEIHMKDKIIPDQYDWYRLDIEKNVNGWNICYKQTFRKDIYIENRIGFMAKDIWTIYWGLIISIKSHPEFKNMIFKWGTE